MFTRKTLHWTIYTEKASPFSGRQDLAGDGLCGAHSENLKGGETVMFQLEVVGGEE